jgi:hypothetical protein
MKEATKPHKQKNNIASTLLCANSTKSTLHGYDSLSANEWGYVQVKRTTPIHQEIRWGGYPATLTTTDAKSSLKGRSTDATHSVDDSSDDANGHSDSSSMNLGHCGKLSRNYHAHARAQLEQSTSVYQTILSLGTRLLPV